jgi:hypothetical protein
MLKLLTCLMKPPPPRAPRPTWREVARLDLAATADDVDEANPPEPAPSPGCGWFDSSHELQCGLAVTEHLSADAVAGELPLADWLELHLSGWRAPGAANAAA